MNLEFRKGRPDEYNDLIDFGNMVFRTDFAALLPKLYRGHPEMAQHHYLALEDGKIKGMVGSFPLEFSMGGETVKAFGIGTVSVHPYARGRGYMKELMNRAVAGARAAGADLMCLGGQRQRYEYFGFGCACQRRSYTLTPANRRHWKKISTEGVELLPLSENGAYTADCLKLHNAQPIHAVRRLGDFAGICRSWSSEPWIFRRNGEFLGYCVLNDGCTAVGELLLNDWQEALPVLFALSEKAGRELTVTPFFWQKELCRALGLVSEGCAIEDGEMVQLLNFPRMLALSLRLKGEQAGIMDGELVLEVSGEGKYRVAVRNGAVSVAETAEPAGLRIDTVQQQRRLFSAGSLWQYDSPLENSWFPLPLELPAQDMV